MSKKVEARVCAVCGKKFTPKATNQIYCSAVCKNFMKRKVEQAKRAAKNSEAKKPVVAKAKLTEKVVLPKKPTKKVEAKKPVEDKTTISVHPVDPYKAIALAFIVMMTEAHKIIASSVKCAKKCAKKGK